MALLLASAPAPETVPGMAEVDGAAMLHWIIGAIVAWRARLGLQPLTPLQQRQIFRDAFRLYLEQLLPSAEEPTQRLPRSVRDQLARYLVLQHVLRRYLRELASPAEQRLAASLRVYARLEVGFCDDYALALGLLAFLHVINRGSGRGERTRAPLSDTFGLATDDQTRRAAVCVARLAARLELRDRRARLLDLDYVA